MPANSSILMIVLFSAFQDIYWDLLHGCCTDGKACMRTRSGMIAILPTAWRSFI
jgi:hypothetical protein